MSEDIQNIQYHAARLLILIGLCGTPVGSPKIKGRTLLAKLDFFLRYPIYLDRALRIKTGSGLDDMMEHELDNVETRMIRYRYGPWDNVYYSVLAYLVAKDLITIEIHKSVEYFGLTEQGKETIEDLIKTEPFMVVAVRARILKKVFGLWSGTRLKAFIYESFPEVVSLSLGQEI
jgi:DNA-binding PadR family transcriptional regulator